MENTMTPSTNDSFETLNNLLNSASWSVGVCIVPSCNGSEDRANSVDASTEVAQ